METYSAGSAFHPLIATKNAPPIPKRPPGPPGWTSKLDFKIGEPIGVDLFGLGALMEGSRGKGLPRRAPY